MEETYRIGEAAAALGVRVETLRRWERDGRLKTVRTSGGQRRVPVSEVARLQADARSDRGRPVAAQSARNRFPGVITEVKRDKLVALVELVSGGNRIVSLITREAADQLGLKPGMKAVAMVKATSVMVELPE